MSLEHKASRFSKTIIPGRATNTTKWHHKFFDLNDGLFAVARRKHPDAIRCLRDKTGIVGLLDPSNFLQQPSPFKHLHGVILEFFEENKAASDADVRYMFLNDVQHVVATQKPEKVHGVFSNVSRFYDCFKLYQDFGTYERKDLEWALSADVKSESEIQRLIELTDAHEWDGLNTNTINREFFNKVSRILRDEPEQLTYAESNFIAGLQFHIAFQSSYFEPTKIYGITQTLNLYAILSSEFIDGLTEYLYDRERIIEVGGGHGVLSRALKERGIRATCTDIRPKLPFKDHVREFDHIAAVAKLRPKTILAVGLPPFGSEWPSEWSNYNSVEEIILIGNTFDSGGMMKALWNFERKDLYFGPVFSMLDRIGRNHIQVVSFKRTAKTKK